MYYVYRCDKCGREAEEARRIDERDEPKSCACGRDMKRVEITYQGEIGPIHFHDGYYPSFGKRINSKRELKNELHRYQAETGSELIEIGNEKEALKRMKAKRAPLPDREMVMTELKKASSGR